MLEIEAADLGHRVDETFERSGRRRREQEEHRLRSDERALTCAPQPVVRGIPAAEEHEKPADRHRDVEAGVPEVEHVHCAREPEDRALQGWLDVEPETRLQGDDPLGITTSPRTAVAAQDERPHKQVQPVDESSERRLASDREPAHSASRHVIEHTAAQCSAFARSVSVQRSACS